MGQDDKECSSSYEAEGIEKSASVQCCRYVCNILNDSTAQSMPFVANTLPCNPILIRLMLLTTLQRGV